MSKRRPDAFTLVETLLAGALLLVLIVLAAEVLLPMARGAARGSTQIHLQQLAELTVERLANDVACAPLEGLTLVTPPGGPTILAVQRLADVTATGGQIWADALSVYWLDPTTARLWHSDWPPAPPAGLRPFTPDQPYQPTVGELQQIVAGTARGRVLAPNVSVWLVDLQAQPPTVRLRLETQGEYFEVSRRLQLRNRKL